MKKYVLTLLLFCAPLTFVWAESLVPLDLMHDAKPVKTTYNVHLSIKSPYKAVTIQPYYYSRTTQEVVKVGERLDVFHNTVNFKFEQSPSSNEYLVFHLYYGPHFVFNRSSESFCYLPIQTYSVVGEVECDTFSTAKYLIAHTDIQSSEDSLVTAPLLERWFELERLPKIQSWQNYLALISFTLNHLSEKPEYLIASTKGNYLKTGIAFTNKFKGSMLKRRRITLTEYESILQDIDKSMVNIGYRVLVSLEDFINESSDFLPYVKEHPAYVQDFYSGIAPFRLVEPESMSLSNIEVVDGTATYTVWPWMNEIQYSIDDADFQLASDKGIALPKDAKYLAIRPFGDGKKYLKSVVQLSAVRSEG